MSKIDKLQEELTKRAAEQSAALTEIKSAQEEIEMIEQELAERTASARQRLTAAVADARKAGIDAADLERATGVAAPRRRPRRSAPAKRTSPSPDTSAPTMGGQTVNESRTA